jgi:hypothetical protein
MEKTDISALDRLPVRGDRPTGRHDRPAQGHVALPSVPPGTCNGSLFVGRGMC